MKRLVKCKKCGELPKTIHGYIPNSKNEEYKYYYIFRCSCTEVGCHKMERWEAIGMWNEEQ